MKKKNKVLIGGIAGLVVVLAVLIVVLIDPFKSEEEKVTNKIQSIGGVFYEDFFYPQQVLGLSEAEIAQKLTAFSTEGISVSLEDVNKVMEISDKVSDPIKEVTRDDAKLVCNPSTTIIITPKEPFSKTDYDIRVSLDCK
ncbi:hypothetical protein AOC36_02110 [Erysipelothrix larvae]|uniref:Uncharacterized protein n=1 Tax=Erysipelothrix larvae TaxID=1514105 RepID=A0A109UGL0_9FIRM|nr:hypothetical protein [Erysipelothrix larvae]AMC92820.1 hypothetical protein AOC36_02110 [Erysipelothrix larvae]